MGANDIQIGGTHYKDREYEHWDFVCDTGIHYLKGCATKYVSRWRDKNGLQDLEKSLHYIDKSMEKRIRPMDFTAEGSIALRKFANQHPPEERAIIYHICHSNFELAVVAVKDLIEIASNDPKFMRG